MKQQQISENNQTNQQITMKQQRKAFNRQKKSRMVLKIQWESKVLHGQCIRSVDRELIGREIRCYGC